MASRRAKKDARGGEIMRTAVNISAQEIELVQALINKLQDYQDEEEFREIERSM